MTDLTTQHDDVWLLLPWYVNNTLQPEEAVRVRDHLQVCLMCRRELSQIKLYADTVRDYELRSSSAEHALENLMLRIRSDESAQIQPEFHTASVLQRIFSGIKTAHQRHLRIFALAWSIPVLIVGLVLWYPVSRDNEMYYHTLTDSSEHSISSTGNIKLVVDKRTSVEQLRVLLGDCRVEIESGPSEIGAYVLRTQGTQSRDNALICLRKIDFVQFAEPLGENYSH